jgi:hypothetical protein
MIRPVTAERFGASRTMTALLARWLVALAAFGSSFTCAISLETRAEPAHLLIENSFVDYLWRERITFSVFDSR